MRTKLLIVQPYIPTYRVSFFTELATRLEELDIDLTIAAPGPSQEQSERMDSAKPLDFQATMPAPVYVAVKGAQFTYLRSRRLIQSSDAVIVPAAATCLDTQYGVFGPGRRHRKVGLWGHIASYVKEPNPIDQRLETLLMRRADHVFAYTDRGSRHAVERGVHNAKVTTVVNTIDTKEIAEAIESITPHDLSAFRAQHGITAARVFAYIGGLDAVKKVKFLADVLDELYLLDPAVQVLVAGRGESSRILEQAIARGQVKALGYADARTKAILGAMSSAIINPGRIGLIAVDAILLGLPIVTTPFKFHGPEFDYLVEGSSVFVCAGTPTHFAQFLQATSFSPPAETAPLAEHMLDNFVDGIVRMMNS